MKIIDTSWFTEQEGTTIGIVVIENEIGDRKAYIGTGAGYDEDVDRRHISERGDKVMPQTLERILKHLKKKD